MPYFAYEKKNQQIINEKQFTTETIAMNLV